MLPAWLNVVGSTEGGVSIQGTPVFDTQRG